MGVNLRYNYGVRLWCVLIYYTTIPMSFIASPQSYMFTNGIKWESDIHYHSLFFIILLSCNFEVVVITHVCNPLFNFSVLYCYWLSENWSSEMIRALSFIFFMGVGVKIPHYHNIFLPQHPCQRPRSNLAAHPQIDSIHFSWYPRYPPQLLNRHFVNTDICFLFRMVNQLFS